MPVVLSEHFVSQYARLPKAIQRKVAKALTLLDADYRHPGLRSHPVQGTDGIFEAYIDDKYRMTFNREGDEFFLRNLDNHDECLKNP
ncbi:cytotoxic translational repressor [Dehalogenimonas lykanthroporepellens BL-DC-9]|nr:cytotoxic translational repressor [Dehalogenimonas lykanthroporepellens BL-DC-9]